jgi:hypothetical protein
MFLIPDPSFTPPALSPVNFVSISRTYDHIRSQYNLDPTLRIPDSVQPALGEGETRKNLKLQTQKGDIDSEIWILPPSGQSTDHSRPALAVNSECGNISLKVVRSSRCL